MSATMIARVVPAQLSFLAIYNPSLGTSDDSVQDQIVFYYSKAAKGRSKGNGNSPKTAAALREEQNEKLRQVGLAQGMVGFARSFSNGEAVDSVETEKSRIVLHELEPGWWILASIDLTQLPAAIHANSKTDAGSTDASDPGIEYSAREVSPPALLIQQIIRANSVFLLHHGVSLEFLFAKLTRPKFCNALDRFWTRFSTHWDVLLHGSPAVDIFGGMKLAAGGELGMGVGEEEYGSGEREVLEDFARRTDGLVDMMVSRFGDMSPQQIQQNSKKAATPKTQEDPTLDPWIGRGKLVNAGDGVVFSGVGALSRRSLRDVSHWVEDIYSLGEYAYGVKDSPTADRRKRRRKSNVSTPRPSTKEKGKSPLGDELPPGIPAPIVKAAQSSLEGASSAVESANDADLSKAETPMASLGDTDAWLKYLTLGYSSSWGGKTPQIDKVVKGNSPPPATGQRGASPEVSMRYVEPEPDIDRAEERLKCQIQDENRGYFVIGLKGSMGDDDFDDDNDDGDWNNRIPLRTVHVELAPTHQMPETPTTEDEITFHAELTPKTSTIPKLSRLRPVVYVHRPFIYTFLFTSRTESLTLASFYRNLHNFFAPLHRLLGNSTSPSRVDARVSAALSQYTTTSSSPSAGPNTQRIYDLVYDPQTLTSHSSLPNIPEPGTLIAEGLSSNSPTSNSGWSRVEALNVHYQILATVAGTRRTLSEIERTCKTSRGWWVVWMRLPPSSVPEATRSDAEVEADPGFRVAHLREAFLVRRSHDAVPASAKSSGSGLGSGMWRFAGGGGMSTGDKRGGAAAGWGPRGLGEGIGIDARRYVEGLLSLNR